MRNFTFRFEIQRKTLGFQPEKVRARCAERPEAYIFNLRRFSVPVSLRKMVTQAFQNAIEIDEKTRFSGGGSVYFQRCQ